MAIVDPKKLEDHRSLIDDEVTRLSLTYSISRPQAYIRVAHELGFYLRVWLTDYEWVCAAAMPLAIVDNLEIGLDTLAEQRFVDSVCNTECRATEPDDAVVATLLRCLDNQADVYHEIHLGGGYDCLDEWDRAFSGGESKFSILGNSEQRVLFESDQEYLERVTMLRRAKVFDNAWSQLIAPFESVHKHYFNGTKLSA